jgi:tetratricopeptide (TPR) repeat protein
MPADRQRLQAFLATLHGDATAQQPDIYQCDHAIVDAILVNDRAALAELYFRRGALHRCVGRFREAISDSANCLRVLGELEADGQPTARLLELDAAIALAGLHLMLGRYDRPIDGYDRPTNRSADPAWRYLTQAEVLLPVVPRSATRAPTIAWMRAQLYRWAGWPNRSLVSIRDAVTGMEEQGAALGPLGQGKLIQTDCALDVAALFGASREHEMLLSEAKAAAQRALELFRRVADEGYDEVALLALARVNRMSARDTDFLPTLESVAFTADRLNDRALLIQAQTALADELFSRSEWNSARNVYIQALETAKHSEMPAMGYWAWRALEAPIW